MASQEPEGAPKGPPEPDLTPARVIRLATEAEGFLDLGLTKRAMGRAEQLARSRAGRQAGLHLQGEILRRTERYAEALPILETAAREFPDDESVWVNIGWCRKRTGRLDLAIEALYELLTRYPDSPLGHYNLACYLCLAGKRERALAELSLALELDGSFRDLIPGENDFDALRGDPEFQKIVTAPR